MTYPYRKPKPDRRAVAKTLRDLDRLFGDLKRESPLPAKDERASKNSDDDVIVPRQEGGAQ